MKRRTTLSIALALSVVLLSLVSLPTVEAQHGRRRQRHANQQTQTMDSAQAAATGQTQSAGQGRRRRRGRRGATTASDTTATQGQQSRAGQPKVTVVRRLNQTRLSAAAIKTIRSMSLLGRFVAVRGNSIRPLTGSSLWQLSNGGYAVIGGGTVEPLASEIWTKDMGDGDLYYAACFCPDYDPNKNDGCEFDGVEKPQNCRQTGGVNCSCKFQDGLIEGLTGKPHTFHAPS